MAHKTALKILLLILGTVIFVTCGDLGSVMPTRNTYPIKTLVNNVSLDECSMVRAGDKVRPYCEFSVTRDPDICGLLVYFQNSQKQIVSGSVRYVLKRHAGYEMPDENELADESEEEIIEEEDVAVDSESDSDSEEETAEEETEADNIETDITETETAVSRETEFTLPSSIDGEIVFHVKKLDNLPVFVMPDNLEIGTYTMVFRVLGKEETLGETENKFYYLGNIRFSFKDIHLYVPDISSDSALIPTGTALLLEAMIDSDPRLNPSIIWYNGKNPIAEGSVSDGKDIIFWKAPERTGFQTLRAEIFPSSNYRGINGITREIVLPVSSKAAKAGLFTDQNIVNIISPKSKNRPNLSVAVDLQGDDLLAAEDDEDADSPFNPVPAQTQDLLHWYQFAGSLFDANNKSADYALMPLAKNLPCWSPMANSYGLATGKSDAFALPSVSFLPINDNKGGGLLLFRIKPVSDGEFLNVQFESTSDPLVVKLSHIKQHLVLHIIKTGRPVKEISIPVNVSGPYLTAAIVFHMYDTVFETRLILDKIPRSAISSAFIPLTSPLSGECRIIIGNVNAIVPDVPAENEEEQEDEQKQVLESASFIVSRNNPTQNVIWNEFSVFYIEPPEPPVVEPEAKQEEIIVMTFAPVLEETEETITGENENEGLAVLDSEPVTTGIGITENQVQELTIPESEDEPEQTIEDKNFLSDDTSLSDDQDREEAFDDTEIIVFDADEPLFEIADNV